MIRVATFGERRVLRGVGAVGALLEVEEVVTSWRGSTSNERNHGQGLLQVVGGQSGCHRRPDQGRVCPYTSSNLREDNTFEKLRIDLGGTRQIESVYRAWHSPFINLGCLE